MMIQWRPVTDYKGFYEVSEYGQIRSLDRLIVDRNGFDRFNKGRPIKTRLNQSGYPIVNLSLNGRIRTFCVHAIVAAAFLGERSEGFHTCHNDGDPSNTRASNLRYDTPSNNYQDRVLHRTSNNGSQNGMAKLLASDVRSIRSRLKKGERKSDTAKDFAVHRTAISNIAHGRTWARLPLA